MKFVKKILVPVCFFMLALPLVAQADDFGGLYYSKGTKAPSTCDRIKQELHPGGMIIDGMKIYRGESVCKLGQSRVTDRGTEFVADCQSEGEPYRELQVLRKTPNGLSIASGAEMSEWSRCDGPKNSRTSTTTKSAWSVKRYSDGTVEQTISNGADDQVGFLCTNGGDGAILVMLSSQEFFGGNIEFIVDGERFNLMTWADRIEINTECRVCADQYSRLMKNIRTGRSMSVVPEGQRPMMFDIGGATKVFDREICSPKGW